MALISTIQLNTQFNVDEKEIAELQKRLDNLPISINLDAKEIERARKFAQSNSLLAIAQAKPVISIRELVLFILGTLGPEVVKKIRADLKKGDEIQKVIETNPNLSTNPLIRAQQANQLLEDKQGFFINVPVEEFIRGIIDKFNETGKLLTIEDVIAVDPEIAKFFDEELRNQINEAVKLRINNVKDNIDKAAASVSQTSDEPIEFPNFFPEIEFVPELNFDLETLFPNNTEIPQIPIEVEPVEPPQGLLELPGLFKNGGSAALAYAGDLTTMNDVQNNAIQDAIILGDKGIGPLNKEFKDTKKQVAQAEKTVGKFDGTAGDATKTLEQTDGAAEQLGENGLPKIKKGAEEAQKALSDIDLGTLAENFSAEQIAGLTGLPIEDIIAQAEKLGIVLKQDVADGVENVEENLKELSNNASFVFDGLKGVLQDTAGILENAFSDVIFSTLKGDFDALQDIWQSTLDSMLRSFSNFVADILARPIKFLFDGNKGKNPDGSDIPLTTSDKVAGGLSLGGAALSTIASQIENDIASSIIGGLGNVASFAGAGLSVGASIGGAAGPIGAAIGAVVGLIASLPSIFDSIFGKKPKLDIDFDAFKVEDESGKKTNVAAQVSDFLDEDIFVNELFNIDAKKAGLGLGKDKIAEIIQDAISKQVEAVQDIINKLPADLASQLNESLLSTQVDIDTEVGGDRLLEFDDKGKSIKKQFEAFINGELQARFLFSIRDFFEGSFESLGVLPDNAQALVGDLFDEFKSVKGSGAKAREARAAIGQELLATFNAFVDAFNFVEGTAVDGIEGSINSIKSLSAELGFDGVPGIEELRDSLGELLETAELDPEVVQDYLQLAAAIEQVRLAILGSIQSIISSISSLNSLITQGGGDAFDLTGFIDQGLDSVVGLLGQEGLSVEDKEELLGLGTGFLDQLIAEEQAAFQAQLEAAQEAAEAAAEAQREAVRAQIKGLENERDLIEENFDKRIEALEEELRLAEEFARLTESIQQTLDSIILGPDSVFTAVERLNIVQGDIASLQSELAATTDPERQLELAGQLQDSLETLFDLAGEAFGVNSPEFVAIFDQVTGGLNDLLDLTGNRERSVEEINAEIEALNIERNQQLEAIDARIESLNERLSSIQAENVDATFQVSDHVLELAEFFRNEYITLLEERFAQLEEVSDTGFTEEIDALNSLDANMLELKDTALEALEIQDSMLVTLRSIDDTLKGAGSFRTGTGGFVDFGAGTLAFLHGREAVVPESQFTPFREFSPASGDMNVNISVNVDGGSSGTVETLATNIEDMLVRSIRQGGKLRSAVQEAGARRIN